MSSRVKNRPRRSREVGSEFPWWFGEGSPDIRPALRDPDILAGILDREVVRLSEKVQGRDDAHELHELDQIVVDEDVELELMGGGGFRAVATARDQLDVQFVLLEPLFRENGRHGAARTDDHDLVPAFLEIPDAPERSGHELEPPMVLLGLVDQSLHVAVLLVRLFPSVDLDDFAAGFHRHVFIEDLLQERGLESMAVNNDAIEIQADYHTSPPAWLMG